MPFRDLPTPRFVSVNPGGQHIHSRPADPENLIMHMPDISEIKAVYDVYKPTAPMEDLISHLRRLSDSPESDLCYNHACCDISNAWNQIGAAGKARVYSGVSAKGGTLVLVFAPIHQHGDYIVEIDCGY